MKFYSFSLSDLVTLLRRLSVSVRGCRRDSLCQNLARLSSVLFVLHTKPRGYGTTLIPLEYKQFGVGHEDPGSDTHVGCDPGGEIPV